METVTLKHRGRMVHHFLAVEHHPDKVVEKYRVVLGDDKDALLEGEDVTTGRRKMVPNRIEVPADAWETGWERGKLQLFRPAPEVTMTVRQFAREVFTPGSLNRRLIDQMIDDGMVELSESSHNALRTYENRIAGQQKARDQKGAES